MLEFLGWPKRCKLAHAFLWKYSYKRLELAQLLGQHGSLLTLAMSSAICQVSQVRVPSAASQTGTCFAPTRLTGMVSFIAGQSAHGITCRGEQESTSKHTRKASY